MLTECSDNFTGQLFPSSVVSLNINTPSVESVFNSQYTICWERPTSGCSDLGVYRNISGPRWSFFSSSSGHRLQCSAVPEISLRVFRKCVCGCSDETQQSTSTGQTAALQISCSAFSSVYRSLFLSLTSSSDTVVVVVQREVDQSTRLVLGWIKMYYFGTFVSCPGFNYDNLCVPFTKMQSYIYTNKNSRQSDVFPWNFYSKNIHSTGYWL